MHVIFGILGFALVLGVTVALEKANAAFTGLFYGPACLILVAGPLFIAMFHHRFFGAGPSMIDEFGLLTVSIAMLLSGSSFRIKSTTLIGGSSLILYVLIVLEQVFYRPQVAVGVYLLAGGGLIFVAGVLLSIYRDRLIALPDRIARREGLFKIMDWR